MPNVFLSYAHQDIKQAEILERQLETVPDCSVWRDKSDLHGGADWEREIRRRIESCDFFIPLISRQFNDEHRYVRKEVAWAHELKMTGKKPNIFIVPCCIEPVDIDIPELRAIHAIDLFEDGYRGLHKLLASLQVFGALADGNPAAKIRLTSHQARFRPSPRMYYFVNIANIHDRCISITHVHYKDPMHSILVQPSSRRLPVMLQAGETWATYFSTERVPDEFRSDAYDKFVARLATGEIYRSTKENSILPAGSVPGGPITLNERGEDPSA